MSDTITIKFDAVLGHDDPAEGLRHWSSSFQAPAWLSGEPRMAAALYLYGFREAVQYITKAEVVNEPLPTNTVNGDDPDCAFTLDVPSREWDGVNIAGALEVPAEREYVGYLVTDDENGTETFRGDVQLRSLKSGILRVVEFDDQSGETHGLTWGVDLADIRKISFY